MLEKICHNKLVIQNLRQSALGEYIDDFVLYLLELGYSKKYLWHRLAIIRKLSLWLTKNNIGLLDLNKERLNQFIKIIKKQNFFLEIGNKKRLTCFIDYLRLRKAVPQSIPVTPPKGTVEEITQAYAKYLDEDKGLCALSVLRNKKIIFEFFCKQFGKNQFDPKKITQNIIWIYIIELKKHYKSRSLQVIASVLRSFLQYLVMTGKISAELANCIPTVPSRRAAALPVFLVKSETKKLLRGCDRRTPNGRRNYAILLLLMRLGLRASEVRKLTLDNINWDLGEADISGKGRKHRVLPLPDDVGKALVSYICYGRPKCSERQIFISGQPPYKGLSNSSSISSIVRRALISVGLNPEQMGAHLLRYTAATESLSNGATLFEIGELLGHCSIDTTAIYTKIDVVSLRDLAKPWPVK